jgi:hypothetical protein
MSTIGVVEGPVVGSAEDCVVVADVVEAAVDASLLVVEGAVV